MKVIAIGGEPGSGKTSLMRKIINKFELNPKYDQFKLVPYLHNNKYYVLGKYEEGEVFSGTDRMSMAVQPEAVKFLASVPKDSVILFEGDRLFNTSFLEHCVENYDTNIVYLSTDKEVRIERYKERVERVKEEISDVVEIAKQLNPQIKDVAEAASGKSKSRKGRKPAPKK